MKFHASVVESIVLACRNYGGHASEAKLRSNLQARRYSAYTGSRNETVLVDADQHLKTLIQQGVSTNGVVPMSLHPVAFERLMYLYDLFSGYDNEQKLRNAISSLDFTVYERKLGPSSGEVVLVLSQDYAKALQGRP